MNQVTLCENLLEPLSWETHATDNVCAFLKAQYRTMFPATGRIYFDYVSDSNDVTPHSEADIERLQKLEGHFFVIVWPEDPITIAIVVAVALAAVSIGISFLMRPNMPAQQEQSPNNQLADRQNKARPNERIPDIFGTVRSTPDLLTVPYKIFIDNIELEFSYMCIGRGFYDIIDCNDDTTPVDFIDGEFAAVYDPLTSPNGASAPERTPSHTFGTNPAPSIPLIKSVQQSGSVNGQILRAPNSGNLNTDNNVAFAYPDQMLSNGTNGLDFTDYFVASDFGTGDLQYLTIAANADGINASDPGGNIHSVSLAGTYLILDVTTSAVTLQTPSAINANWNIVDTFTGSVSTYDHSFSITGDGDVWDGPYILQIADMDEVWCNFVEPNGLYYIDGDGNQHSMTVTIQVGVQGVDINNNPVGDEIFGTVSMSGSSVQQQQVGATLQMVLPSAGFVQVRAQRLTDMGTDNNDTYAEQIQWRDLFGVSPVAETNFGDVTTAFCITTPTQDALSIKERKINMLVTRKLPTWNNRTGFALTTGQTAPTFSTTLYPTNNAADIFCAMALDPYIGRRSIAELDVPGIYSVADSAQLGMSHANGEIATYFGTFLATEFCYTFDDSKVSFEEAASNLAQALNCIAYRQGSKMSLSFEKQTSNSTLLFNHRNKVPDSETRTVTFGTLNDNDGIEYDYIDPNAPNYPNIDTTVTLYFPTDQSAQNPKKITSTGVRNNAQATLNGWRLYQKLIFQNSQTEFESTQEAALSILYDRILVADNTRSDTQDGEIIGQTALLLTTSQPLNFIAGQTYTVFLQHYDETVEAIAVTAGPGTADFIAAGYPGTNQMILATAPRLPLVYDRTMFALTTYMLVGSAPTRSNAFLLAQKDPQENNTYKLTAVNYDDKYYLHDKDVVTGVLVPPPFGYATQGYTGSGTNIPAGTPWGGSMARPAFSASSYNSSPLHTANNVATPQIATVGGTYAPQEQLFTVNGV